MILFIQIYSGYLYIHALLFVELFEYGQILTAHEILKLEKLKKIKN